MSDETFDKSHFVGWMIVLILKLDIFEAILWIWN